METPETFATTGTIVYWNNARKWGFIDVDESPTNILFNADGTFERGQRVSFNVLPVGAKGPMAVDVVVVQDSET